MPSKSVANQNGNQEHAGQDMTPAACQLRVEAALWLAKSPLTLRRISELAELEDATQARTMVKQLNDRYRTRGRVFRIRPIAGGYQLLTAAPMADWIEKLGNHPKNLKITPLAMETLTIIAYRQPIVKAEIEAIRGVASSEMIRQLLELNLIKIAGKSEKLGRPFLYCTTREFLVCFGLNKLQDLPHCDELAGVGLPNWNGLDNLQTDQKNDNSPLH